MLERGLLILLWLMPFVRLEPAPVDFLIWALGGYLFFKQPQAFWRSFPLLACWGVLLLLVAHVSLIWVPDLGRGAFFTLATLEMFVLLVLFASSSRRPAAWKGVAFAYLGGSSLAAALGVLAYFGWLPYREIFLFGDMRAMALFKDPNVFGAHLVPAVILLWALVLGDLKQGLGWRVTHGGMSFLLTLGVLLAGSRTAWGGLVLGLGLYILLLLIRDWDWSRLRRGWAVGLGMILALAMSFHPQVWPMVKERAAFIKPYDYDRFSAQEEALTTLRLFGVGPGQSEVILQYATHNLYLRVLYELGIIGALGLILLLIAVGAGLRRGVCGGDPRGTALVAVMISLLAMSFFIDSLHWRHLFVFFGLALGGTGEVKVE